MVIKKHQSTPIKEGDNSTIWDYPMPSEETGISYQILNGRKPEKGWYRNTVCREIIFVIDGKASVNIDDDEFDLSSGDVVILEVGQKHFGNYHNTRLITVTSPNWYEEQCKIIED